jgi:hypothetical protein
MPGDALDVGASYRVNPLPSLTQPVPSGPKPSPNVMAPKRPSTRSAAEAAWATHAAEPLPAEEARGPLPDWMAQAAAQGVKPEQALAFIGLGLMRRMAGGEESGWIWNEEEDGGSVDLAALRQRLEITQLALQTGAPLSTAELTELLGTRPCNPVVSRGGLTARRVSRNVWILSRTSGDSDRSSSPFFSEGIRRRL